MDSLPLPPQNPSVFLNLCKLINALFLSLPIPRDTLPPLLSSLHTRLIQTFQISLVCPSVRPCVLSVCACAGVQVCACICVRLSGCYVKRKKSRKRKTKRKKKKKKEMKKKKIKTRIIRKER